jgi:hypothetical protein
MWKSLLAVASLMRPGPSYCSEGASHVMMLSHPDEVAGVIEAAQPRCTETRFSGVL